jgi:Thioredoxin
MVFVSGDVYPYGDDDFDERIQIGKHFIQFWKNKCEESKFMIPLLMEIDEALGQGAEDIWVARVQTNIHSDLKQRFSINVTPVVILIVEGKYYTYDGFWRLPDVLEYIRGGYLNDDGKDIPPSISPKKERINPALDPSIEIIEPPPLSTYDLLLDRMFGEPEVVFSERKLVVKLKKFILYLFVASLVSKAIFSRLKLTAMKTRNKVD